MLLELARVLGELQSLLASPQYSSSQHQGKQGAVMYQPSGFSLPRFRGEVSDCQAQSSQCCAPGIVQPHAALIWAGLKSYEPVLGLFLPFNNFVSVRHFFSPVRKNPTNIFRAG